MTERPILFSGPMVRALLDGTKTQTRRVITPVPFDCVEDVCPPNDGVWAFRRSRFDVDPESDESLEVCERRCPYGVVGDRLWVRESWAIKNWTDRECEQMGFANAPQHPTEVYLGTPTRAVHRASWLPEYDGHIPEFVQKWKPSIHMPRWASRITLEITDVRVERVQDISEADARAEGVARCVDPDDATPDDDVLNAECGYFPPRSYVAGFARLWDELNKPRGYGWTTNPWVWCLSFCVLSPWSPA